MGKNADTLSGVGQKISPLELQGLSAQELVAGKLGRDSAKLLPQGTGSFSFAYNPQDLSQVQISCFTRSAVAVKGEAPVVFPGGVGGSWI